MHRLLACASLLLSVGATAAAQPESLSQLKFLLGEWEAVDTGPAEAGAFTFRLAVQDHLMVRTNQATYPATSDRPASRHDDLMVIYGENRALKAEYFDSEGHVIRYVVRSSASNVVVFISELSPGSPQYRLTYATTGDGLLTGRFEIAAPGAPDDFKPYLSWKARRRRE
jgi:hypothetical protein